MRAAAATELIPEIEPVENAEARAIVEHAIERYFATRQERVAAFVARIFDLIDLARATCRAI